MNKLSDADMISRGQQFLEASLQHLPDSIQTSRESRESLIWFTQGLVLRLSEGNIADDEQHRYPIVHKGILRSVFGWTDAELEEASHIIKNGKFHEWSSVVGAAWDGLKTWKGDAESADAKRLSQLLGTPSAKDDAEDGTFQVLVDESRRLSKPCFNLYTASEGEELRGIWRGKGIVAAPAGNWRHWCSVECRWLREHGFDLAGWMSIYESSTGEFCAVVDDVAAPEPSDDAVRLAGKESVSVPPIPALCRFGGDAIDAWLSSLELSRDDTEAVNDPYLDEEYNDYWQDTCPLYTGDADIVIGGWHLPWPDEASYVERTGKLCLVTYRDSEPWIEVWLGENSDLTVVARLT